jgi:hypothetical protein
MDTDLGFGILRRSTTHVPVGVHQHDETYIS